MFSKKKPTTVVYRFKPAEDITAYQVALAFKAILDNGGIHVPLDLEHLFLNDIGDCKDYFKRGSEY